MRRLSFVAFVSLAVAQLAGCSSCLRDEEQPKPEQPTVITPRGKVPALGSKYRIQLYQDAGGGDD